MSSGSMYSTLFLHEIQSYTTTCSSVLRTTAGTAQPTRNNLHVFHSNHLFKGIYFMTRINSIEQSYVFQKEKVNRQFQKSKTIIGLIRYQFKGLTGDLD